MNLGKKKKKVRHPVIVQPRRIPKPIEVPNWPVREDAPIPVEIPHPERAGTHV